MKCLFLIHRYHLDIWKEFEWPLLCNFSNIHYDICINTPEDNQVQYDHKVMFPNAVVIQSPNRGLDIGGTIALLDHVDLSQYDLVCKLHTKSDPDWRRGLVKSVLYNVQETLDIFKNNPDVMMAGSDWHFARYTDNSPDHPICLDLCKRLHLDSRYLYGHYISGTIFWCRPNIFQRIKEAGIKQSEMEPGYAPDGQIAHAIERVFGALARSCGIIYGISNCR